MIFFMNTVYRNVLETIYIMKQGKNNYFQMIQIKD